MDSLHLFVWLFPLKHMGKKLPFNFGASGRFETVELSGWIYNLLQKILDDIRLHFW